MNILQLEQERAKLKEKLTAQYSAQARLLFLFSFFDKVLSTENNNLIDAFLPEFISEYVFCLKNYSVFGLKPRIHESIIYQAEQIKNGGHTSGFEGFSEIIIRLKKELEKLQKILSGEHIEAIESKAYFPLLEEEAIKETGLTIGILELVTVKINPTKTSDKFIIVPSEKEIEEKISEQVVLSWFNAISMANKYIKRIHPFHEVIISFDKKAGFCKGNSLGTALTLSFIEEIFKTYNSPLSIKVGDGIAFTGGIDEMGKITNTSQEIIKQKTELVFFSDISLFIVPKNEEIAANEKLNKLRDEYPQRDLKIIGIEDIRDLLDRRTIVEIKKQPVVVRGGKFLRKNWVTAVIAIILTVILSFFFVLDFDDNPSYITADEQNVQIKNKNGRILWTKHLGITKQFLKSPYYLNSFVIIVDINSDGENEIIICGEQNKKTGTPIITSMVRCYNSSGAIVWQYNFDDTIVTGEDTIKEFSISLIDTLSFDNQKSLFLSCHSVTSAPSAIFRISIENGRRLPGTFWASGHIMDGIIKDFDDDDTFEIIGVGYDNGYEDLVFFIYDIDTLTKVRPTKENYLTKAFPKSIMKSLIRFSKTDFDNYNKVRTPSYMNSSFAEDKKSKRYKFATGVPDNNTVAELGYEISYNLKDIDIVVGSTFRVQRDTLVAKGILQPPYTDTKEYIELQKSKILYWKDGAWVKREELK